MSLIIFKPHCSFWIYSQICQALSCLWPLPILFPLPGRVFARLMPPTSDLLNITSLRRRDFPDLIESSSLSPLLFILRPLFFFFFLYSTYSQLVIILTSIVSAFCLFKAGKLNCYTVPSGPNTAWHTAAAQYTRTSPRDQPCTGVTTSSAPFSPGGWGGEAPPLLHL